MKEAAAKVLPPSCLAASSKSMNSSFNLWDPASFVFEVGVTPFSNPVFPISTSVGYLVVIFSLYMITKSWAKMQLKVLATIHNFIMFIISLVCFIAMTYSLGMTLWNYQDGWERLTCDTNNTIVNRGTLYYWIYLFYLSKAYEMLDTVIMVLRKTPLNFLHVYHHCVTLTLCYHCLYDGIPVQWIATWLNSFVHIPMYWYYFLAILGIPSAIKKYITSIQIIQFVIILIVQNCVVAYQFYFANGSCTGFQGYGNWVGLFIVWSYLFLFIKFYRDTYINQKRGASKAVGHAGTDAQKKQE